MPMLTPENISVALQIGGVILGAIGAAVALVWKLSRIFHTNAERMGRIADCTKALTIAVNNLATKFATLETLVAEREKDTLRLEGALETTRKDLALAAKGLNLADSNVKALWITLRNLFPDKVPARMSDRG